MIPYIENFYAKHEADELFEFIKTEPFVRPPNPRNKTYRLRRLSFPGYSPPIVGRHQASFKRPSNYGVSRTIDDAPELYKEFAAKLSEFAGKEINYLSTMGYVMTDHMDFHQHEEDKGREDQTVWVLSLGAVHPVAIRPKGDKDKSHWEIVYPKHGSLYVLPSAYNLTHEHAVLYGNDDSYGGLRIAINTKHIPPISPIARFLIDAQEANAGNPKRWILAGTPGRKCDEEGCDKFAVPDWIVEMGGDGTKCYAHGGNVWGPGSGKPWPPRCPARKPGKGWDEATARFREVRNLFDTSPRFERARRIIEEIGFKSVEEETVLLRLFRDYVVAVARMWRKRGFPHPVLNYAQKDAELDKLLKHDYSKLIIKGEDGKLYISQEMIGLSLANSYFPQMASVRVGKMLTPLDVFVSAVLFEKAIMKRVRYGEFRISGKAKFKLTINEIRKALKNYTGAQGVSNFRPSAASSVYAKYLPEAGGTVWDFSAGWGGRLLGAISCDRVRKYVGCDPSAQTYKGLVKMQVELLTMARRMGRNMDVELHMLESETQEMRDKLQPNSVDCIFSSPPYFAQETYCDESTQSCKRYPDQKSWLGGFLGGTLDNCSYCLKPGGFLVINLADVSSYKGSLEHDFLASAASKGWELVETLQLRLSSNMGSTKHKSCRKCQALTGKEHGTKSVGPAFKGKWKKCQEHKYKHEPVFVFKRK